jgi:hypothetical protein
MNVTTTAVRRIAGTYALSNPNGSFVRMNAINEVAKKMQEKAKVAQFNRADNTSFKRMVLINEMGKKMEQQAKQQTTRIIQQQSQTSTTAQL